ncbi:low affinity iron permease family protein [Flavobacterium sp.]|uniref:low affinity iron permease family protein n=1 Tax=Flavobacterium sp. TaxID=239 RepID=UPI00341A15BE
MVFLIQKAQNKDSLAIQLKLNELVASSEYASNRLVDIEDMTESEMEVVKKYYQKLSDLSEKENSLHITHSVDEAETNQKMKNTKTGVKTTKKESVSDKKSTAKHVKK